MFNCAEPGTNCTCCTMLIILLIGALSILVFMLLKMTSDWIEKKFRKYAYHNRRLRRVQHEPPIQSDFNTSVQRDPVHGYF
uniref:CX domain-containing protein n=1 Tax=Steinernema glaseri TaxID=37863 RepID=A0A1I7YG87_9BILA